METSIDGAIQDFLRQTDISSTDKLTVLLNRFLDTTVPNAPEDPDIYVDQLLGDTVNHGIQVSSPQFIGHMTAALPYFVRPLAKLMVAMNQNLVKAETSKIFTPYERQVLAKLHRLIYQLPDSFYQHHTQDGDSTLGIITSGGTIANITALWCARNAALKAKDGFAGVTQAGLPAALKAYGYEGAAIIGSQLMHYSFDKAVDVLGMGSADLLKVPVTEKSQVDLAAFQAAIAQCQAQKKLIIAIVGVGGTTDSGGVDPLPQIADLAESVQAHFHVDAAWGGPLIFSQEHRPKLTGIERADSVTIDAHKQLYLPMGTGMVFFRNPALALGIEKQAPYTIRKDSIDLGRRSLEGSRANTALLVHAGLHLIGIQGYEFLINEGIRKTQYLAQKIKESEQFELLAEPQINLLIYRFVPAKYRLKAQAKTLNPQENEAINTANLHLQNLQKQTGRTFVSRTTTCATPYGQEVPIVALRVVLANPLTTEADIDAVLADQLKLVNESVGAKSSPALSPAKQALLEKWKKKSSSVQQIKRLADRSRIPLSFAQKRIWFIDQYQNGSPFYNLPGGLRLEGTLDLATLQQSLNQILQRHEAWRTAFRTVDGEPIQVILSDLTWNLRQISLPRSTPNWDTQLQELAQQETQRPFDLTQAPLVRATLVRVDATEHILLLVMHHMVADGWSVGVFMQELMTLYTAFSQNQPSPLTDLTIHYADFTVWQQERFTGPHLDKQLAYWKQQLQGDLPRLELAIDPSQSPQPGFKGAKHCFEFDPTVTTSIQQLSQRQNTTLFMVLLAAFNVLLYRYSGQDDIILGSAIANRNQPELERLLGCFVNLIPLRTNLQGDPSFSELLQRVRDLTLDAYTHQNLPFEKLVEALQPDRDLNRHPLFQTMFVLQNSPAPSYSSPNLTWSLLELDGGMAMFDMFLAMIEDKQPTSPNFGCLRGVLEYNTDRFTAETIAQFTRHFQTLIQAVVANPDQPISTIPLLAEAETTQLLAQQTQTTKSYPQNLGLHQWFEQQVEQTPELLCLKELDTTASLCRSLTYQGLNSQANQLAHYLQTLGVTPGTLVGVCLERSTLLITTILAILKLGGTYVPLDPSYPRDRLEFMVQDCQAAIVVTESRFKDLLAHDTTQGTTQVICLDQHTPQIENQPSHNLALEIPLPPAYVIYTSGSTGRPKGVLGTHKGTVNGLTWLNRTYPFSPEAVCCHKTAISFVDSIWEIFAPLVHGIPAVILPDNLSQAPAQLLQVLKDQHISHLVLVPSLLKACLDHYPDLTQQLTHLKRCITSGETLSPQLAQQFRQHLPHSQLINLYGSSEVSANVTHYDVTQLPTTATQVPIGYPIDNTQAYVLDRHLQPLPIGVVGELYIGGMGVAQGYLAQPELTAEKFIPSPFATATPLFRTGDLARYGGDGSLEYLGRRDDQVKIRGIRVELDEIKAVLLRHPMVEDTIVLAYPDDNGQQSLAAYLIIDSPDDQVGEIRAHLQAHLPKAIVPSVLIQIDQMPLLPNGKIDKRSLPKPVAPPSNTKKFTTPPRSSVELALAQIWQPLLGLETIDVTDNFFEIGGHSLLAVRLLAQINQQFQQNLPLSTLFNHGTIAQLAQVLEQKAGERSPIVPLQTGNTRPPLFCIHPAGGNVVAYPNLVKYLGDDQPFYALEQMPVDPDPAAISIEAMAQQYIGEIQKIQPEGPYYLAGWCYGGVVAFEMAAQLQQQQQTVQFLGVMDAILHKPDPQQTIQEDDAQFLLRIAASAKNLFGIEFDLTYEELRCLEPDQQFKLMMHRGNIENSTEIDYYLRSYKLFKVHVQAMRNYYPKPHGCPMTLFRGSETIPHKFQNPEFTTHDSLLGWGNYLPQPKQNCPQSIRLIHVPGNHFSMFTEPHVEHLSHQLRTCLDAALSR
jgi:putative pyridoxal-dependent aspartate 1-decarboxylase